MLFLPDHPRLTGFQAESKYLFEILIGDNLASRKTWSRLRPACKLPGSGDNVDLTTEPREQSATAGARLEGANGEVGFVTRWTINSRHLDDANFKLRSVEASGIISVPMLLEGKLPQTSLIGTSLGMSIPGPFTHKPITNFRRFHPSTSFSRLHARLCLGNLPQRTTF